MTRLKAENPQVAEQINNAMNSGAKPQDLVKQMTQNMSREDMQGILKQAKEYGIPESILKEVQNYGIN